MLIKARKAEEKALARQKFTDHEKMLAEKRASSIKDYINTREGQLKNLTRDAIKSKKMYQAQMLSLPPGKKRDAAELAMTRKINDLKSYGAEQKKLKNELNSYTLAAPLK